MAVIDSQQVGRAKLELYKSQRETRLAEVNCKWHRTVYENTLALIQALKQGIPITEIEKRFQEKPMGEYRDRLLSAYAELHKARADYERLLDVTERGIVAGKQMLAAKAALEAAQAKFAGDLEQIRFLAERNKIAAEQELEKARTTEAVNHELLVILGYRDIRDEEIDPRIQREAISHYEVRAPFDGTVISKDVVLLEQVDPSTQMFAIADFSTVWLQADIYEKYLPLLASLEGKTVHFRAAAYPDRRFEATVFYAGNVVDAKTRTADMRAIAKNPDGQLKPGMFVEIELPGEVIRDVIHVPRTAVAEEDGRWFVFVQKSEEEFERRDVQVGRSAGERIEIVQG
ncbi:MAG: efflux RND transporter periplasmic adaptor subunit, partial [Planctomycetes bacterium]|nr:efflux RND transporter periplasmic adaptor subunit [Planctomycetota bacterium]